MNKKNFIQQKLNCLKRTDLSRKGSIDSAIANLVSFLNEQFYCFTTSSCSGRIIIVNNINDAGDVRKKGCTWLYVTHDKCTSTDIVTCLSTCKGSAVFKFEPMVMHIQTLSVEVARQLNSAAVVSGFRNSGISIGGKGKIIVAIRSAHGLDAPVCDNGRILVSTEYIEYLVKCANMRMMENLKRIERFFCEIKVRFSLQLGSVSSEEGHVEKVSHTTTTTTTVETE